MTPEQIGSWLIVASFLIALAYLIKTQRDYSLLALAAKFSTALLLSFTGLLFTGLVAFIGKQLGWVPSSPLMLALLVPIGTLLTIAIHARWRSRQAH